MIYSMSEKSEAVSNWVKKQKARSPRIEKDTLQDVAEKILRLPALEIENFGGYASRILKNCFLDRRRREKLQERFMEQSKQSKQENHANQFVPSDDLRLDLLKALSKFSRKERKVIVDYFLHGFTLRQIAGKYRVRKVSGWHRWLEKKARPILKEALKDYAEEFRQ